MASEEIRHGLSGAIDGQQLIEMQIDGAREHTLSILDGSTHCCGELGPDRQGTSRATSSLSLMLGDFHAPLTDVEDLSSDAYGWRAVVQLSAALHASFGNMDDDLIGMSDLSKC